MFQNLIEIMFSLFEILFPNISPTDCIVRDRVFGVKFSRFLRRFDSQIEFAFVQVDDSQADEDSRGLGVFLFNHINRFKRFIKFAGLSIDGAENSKNIDIVRGVLQRTIGIVERFIIIRRVNII